MRFSSAWLLGAVLLLSAAAGAQGNSGGGNGDLLIRNATVITATHGTLENASILVHAGKIARIGRNLTAPAGVPVIDATGKYVMPGIIDEHSHTAIDGGVNEGAPAVSAMAHIKDVINPHDINLYRQLAGGVTIIHILHGSANVIGGEDAVVRLKWGDTVDQLLYPGAPQGIKMALGENPKHSNFGNTGPNPRFPNTREGVQNVAETAFTEARQYMHEWDAYNAAVAAGRHPSPPRRNLDLDPLVGVLRGQILVHCHSYRADEILMLLNLADEFGFKIRTLEHGLEAYKLAPELRAHDVGVSTFADFWQYKNEATEGTAYNAAFLAQRGIRVAVNSDSDERARRLYQEAAKAMHYGGATEQQAIQMITLNPAWMLGIDRTTGSIDIGKDADFAIFSGHPFAPASAVTMTIVDGKVYFDRARDLAQRKTAAEYERLFKPGGGGFGAFDSPFDNTKSDGSIYNLGVQQ
jgi:imidazolonepropionase-like amidohydrolase